MKKHFQKIIAVTCVAAFLFSMLMVPGSAAAKGKYGGGGLNPPVTNTQYVNYNVLFVPYGVNSNGIYTGKFFLFPEDVSARVIYRQNSDGSYDVGIQAWKSSSGAIGYGFSQTVVSWHASSHKVSWTSVSTSYASSKYGCYIGLYNCSEADFLFADDSTWMTYVTGANFYDSSVYLAAAPFYPSDSVSGTVYHVIYPLVSNFDDWEYNYGYETEQERQEAIEQSRYDEQNKIIQEGFTQVIQSINDGNIVLQEAIHEGVNDIINAGSDMPELNTDNNWMNDSLTKVNGWLTEIGEFESQMRAAEVENSENMAQASQFVNGFFGVVPSAIIAGLTLLLVIIVVVKLVGR